MVRVSKLCHMDKEDSKHKSSIGNFTHTSPHLCQMELQKGVFIAQVTLFGV